MVSRYSNELNSFRSGIEDRVTQHKDKLGAINQALGIKADKVFENAKKISDIGGKLTESGIGGGVGATALGKYARKGITKFNTFKQAATDKVKGLADQAESKLQEAGSKVEGKVGDLQAQAEGKVGELQDAAGNAETQVRQTAQNAQSTVETKAQDARDSVVPANETDGARQGVGGDSASGNSLEESVNTSVRVARPGDQILQDKYIGMRKGGLAGEEAEGGTELTGPAGAEEATTATTEATTESTLTGTAIDLEEDAAATSWLGFLGVPEILAGLGAIAGVAAAGVGIADAVKSGSETAQAQAMPTSAPKTGFQAAGTFVVPTQDSVS